MTPLLSSPLVSSRLRARLFWLSRLGSAHLTGLRWSLPTGQRRLPAAGIQLAAAAAALQSELAGRTKQQQPLGSQRTQKRVWLSEISTRSLAAPPPPIGPSRGRLAALVTWRRHRGRTHTHRGGCLAPGPSVSCRLSAGRRELGGRKWRSPSSLAAIGAGGSMRCDAMRRHNERASERLAALRGKRPQHLSRHTAARQHQRHQRLHKDGGAPVLRRSLEPSAPLQLRRPGLEAPRWRVSPSLDLASLENSKQKQ